MRLAEKLLHHSTIGTTGNRSTGKTMTCLTLLKAFKREFPNKTVVLMGVEESLREHLEAEGFEWCSNKNDILDLKYRNAFIYVAEFGMLFETKNRGVMTRKLERFFDRLEHNHCKVLLDTAREGFYNKFMCSRITAFIVKEIEYSSLVNGTWLNEKVRNHISLSDYRLQMPINQFVFMSNKHEPTRVYEVAYDPKLDSKAKEDGFFTDAEKEQLQNDKPTVTLRKKQRKSDELSRFVKVVGE